jgi:hypothetical protein
VKLTGVTTGNVVEGKNERRRKEKKKKVVVGP